ncbi:GntR family transcriptional regulator [Rhizobium acaciae]|uniref:GntR family transcriptional regulator n=1 Tax=Rhizobium acaciae TaxID=2989736 RepID=UPI0029C9D111|nr:GntR family transcriptional regulator [Rhizobium acaciae]
MDESKGRDFLTSATSDVMRDQVYERLGELIRSGQFAPGEEITIRNLAKDFEVSPTPVREALYRLIGGGRDPMCLFERCPEQS